MSIDPPANGDMTSAVLGAAGRQATVAIVGGSYVGMRLAQALVPVLPATHKLVVVEANSHFHHLFTFPRFSVLHRGGEEKALVPYTHALEGNNAHILHARALAIESGSGTGGVLKLDRSVGGEDTLPFDVLAIATGTRLQEPWSLPSTAHDGVQAKAEAVQTLRTYQDDVRDARKIVIVGGGAVGVQVACDIAELYNLKDSGKNVTLIHSRPQLMNKFHADLHGVVAQRFAGFGVQTVLGKRVKLPSAGKFPAFQAGQFFDIELLDGSTVPADLVLTCTGQTPRSDLLATFAPQALTADKFIDVHPTMQIRGEALPAPSERIFALGDIANSGAAKTVRAAMGQIDVITSNILALIEAQKSGTKAAALKTFTPGPAGIHLSVGLYESIKFGNPSQPDEPPRNLGIEKDLALDMGIENTWAKWNVPKDTPWHL